MFLRKIDGDRERDVESVMKEREKIKETGRLFHFHLFFSNSHLRSLDNMCEDTVFACICRDFNVSGLT